jgi:alkylhydroperoxidase/carboxymuconolactone decarboxylase family protein YurZ
MPQHPLAVMEKIDPALIEHMRRADELVYADGALPRKIKLLMALAFDAAHGASAGVKALAGAAMHAGATPQEIGEAIRVAYHLAGVGSVYTAGHGLDEIVGE